MGQMRMTSYTAFLITKNYLSAERWLEVSVCREMARSMGFPKLEAGLCAMTKEDLANSLAYNSLKVWELDVYKFYNS